MTCVYKLKALPSEYMIETQDVFDLINVSMYVVDGWISQNMNMTTPLVCKVKKSKDILSLQSITENNFFFFFLFDLFFYGAC